MILEVIVDMRFFLYILLFTLFAFSGSFRLLSMNSPDKDEQYVTSLVDSNLKLY